MRAAVRRHVQRRGANPWLNSRCKAHGLAHFLFADGAAARRALEAAQIRVLAVREVLVQRLDQDVPGQLGMLARRMAGAGVNIEVVYSDHQNQLVLVVDDVDRGRQVSEAWSRAKRGRYGDVLRYRSPERFQVPQLGCIQGAPFIGGAVLHRHFQFPARASYVAEVQHGHRESEVRLVIVRTP